MEKRNDERSLLAIVFGLVTGLADNLRYNVQRQMEVKRKMIIKKITAGILLLVGLVLFLNGLALMIDTFADNFWVGHTVVGFIVLIAGYFLLKSNGKNNY